MFSGRTKYSIAASVGIAFLFLLGGCAANAEKDTASENPVASTPQVKCPVGYMMICEAKKTGRIRFGTLGKDKLESCTCEPENTGRPPRTVIPSIN